MRCLHRRHRISPIHEPSMLLVYPPHNQSAAKLKLTNKTMNQARSLILYWSREPSSLSKIEDQD